MEVVEPPEGEVAALVAFAITTEGPQGPSKGRRGEDWRGSHHNATTQTVDGPRHHTIDDLISAELCPGFNFLVQEKEN